MTGPSPHGVGRVAFADLDDAPLIAALRAAATGQLTASAATALARAAFTAGALPGAVADHVIGSAGPLARLSAEGRVDESQLAMAGAELRELGALAHLDLGAVLAPFGLQAAPAGQERPAPWFPPDARSLRALLATHPHWDDHVHTLVEFWSANGVGVLATHRVLRLEAGRLVGVTAADGVRLDQLIGGAAERDLLARSLAAFVAGGPPVDALLYGAPGTGKSTAVRALAGAHAEHGLRLIQVERDQLGGVRELFAQVAGGPRCLVLLDDLVFDDGARTDRDLRGVLEGDVADRPANVVVWATSNRMRLLHETRSEREEDLEGELGRGERSALATRFGIRQAFVALPVTQFVAMASALVERRTGLAPAGLEAAARRFGVDRGLTPRSARQFADLVVGGVLMEA